MLFAWKANSCNLMIALMHQKEANKNGADINGYLTDLRWRNSNNNGKLGGRESLPISAWYFYI